MNQSPLRVLSIIGTRPEAIKMAPVVRALEARANLFNSVVCLTAQHRQMLDQVMQIFGLRGDLDLDLMRPDQSLAGLTARLFEELDRVLLEVKPDWVLAQGDTTTVMVASLVAFYRGVRFGHVEAGLRTHDRRHPFPEEINRRVADLVADAYFAPTERSREALLREGVPDARIVVAGNTVVDALIEIAGRDYDWTAGPLGQIDKRRPVALVTAHRRESFGEPFRELCRAIAQLADDFPAVQWIYPVHLNPNVRRPVEEILRDRENIRLLEPLDYVSLVQLMKHAVLVLTDSGGIQEEAPTFGVPVLVMRETTERPEGIEAGCAELVGTSREKIVERASAKLKPMGNHRPGAFPCANPYGDGRAAERIVEFLAKGAD